MNSMAQIGVGNYLTNVLNTVHPSTFKTMSPLQIQELFLQAAGGLSPSSITPTPSRVFIPKLSTNPIAPPPPLLCKVCQARCQSINGEPVCKSCRDFFRRSILHNRVFRCPYSGTCSIDHTAIHDQCKACRMKKCRELRMVVATRGKTTSKSVTPILKVQETKPAPAGYVRPQVEKQRAPIESGSPDIQFLNIKQVTASFLKDVIKWPKKMEMFQVLEDYIKLDLVNSQWSRLMIVSICDHGAFLLDLQEDLANIAHTFHTMTVTSREAHWMKACLLFMKTNPDGSYLCPLDLDDSLKNLHKELMEVHDPELRYGELVTLIGKICKVSLGGIESLFVSRVKELLHTCL